MSSMRLPSILSYLVLAPLFWGVLGLPAQASETGRASWYALTSKTASGEYANPSKMTAAHRKLPFGSRVKVTNLHNGRSVVVRINDRGPFVKGRIIDVTKAAASALKFVARGHARVRVVRVARGTELGLQPRWAILAKLKRLAVPKPSPRKQKAR